MSKSANQRSFCKTVCWLIGLVVGGYAAYALVNDFQVEAWLAGVIGIVTLLLLGLSLRRIFCRGHANRVRERVAEAKKQAKAEAPKTLVVQAGTPRPEAVDPPTAQPAAADAAEKPAFEKPAADAIYDALNDKILAAADTVAEEVPEEVAEAPVETVAEPAEDPPQPDEKAKPKDVLTLEPSMRHTTSTDSAEEEDAPDLSAQPPVEEVMKTVAKAIRAEMTAADGSEPAPGEADGAEKSVTIEVSEKVETPAEKTVEPEPDKPAQTPPPIKPLKPKGLEAPEDGAADDLSQIDGIEAELAAELHRAGIYHYSQFVTMNRRELAWLDENIAGAAGASAEIWRKQAILLRRKAEQAG